MHIASLVRPILHCCHQRKSRNLWTISSEPFSIQNMCDKVFLPISVTGYWLVRYHSDLAENTVLPLYWTVAIPILLANRVQFYCLGNNIPLLRSPREAVPYPGCSHSLDYRRCPWLSFSGLPAPFCIASNVFKPSHPIPKSLNIGNIDSNMIMYKINAVLECLSSSIS
jgi:hypothetical protein